MSVQLAPTSTPLGAAVLRHLDAQVASTKRLLDLVVAQGRAIRRREVDAVLQRLAEIQVEMERRGKMERDRAALLQHAGQQLQLPAHAVTLELMASLFAPDEAQLARERSAELRGLLAEVAREHTANRALMKQELAFLDHLTRMLGGGEQGASYGATGRPAALTQTGAFAPQASSRPSLRALDLEA